MAAPIPLRGDFDASELRVLARKSKDGPQARRLLALAAIYEGATRSEAAKIGGVGLQIIREWVLRFNARGPCGLLDGSAPGQPSKRNVAQRQAVAEASPCGSRARLFLVDGTAMRSQTHGFSSENLFCYRAHWSHCDGPSGNDAAHHRSGDRAATAQARAW